MIRIPVTIVKVLIVHSHNEVVGLQSPIVHWPLVTLEVKRCMSGVNLGAA
ncbi:hypothetical protein [Bacillus sp. JCM 19041]